MTDTLKTLQAWEDDAKAQMRPVNDGTPKYLHKRILILCKALRSALTAMETASKSADAGYLDAKLDASVITISDDDFYSCAGFPRDTLDVALIQIESIIARVEK